MTTRNWKITSSSAVDRIVAVVVAAYEKQDNPGNSDLDNEQPIALSIHVLLGDLRRLRVLR